MRYISFTVLAALLSSAAPATKTAKFRDQKPDVSVYANQSMFDIERCMINVSMQGVTTVYRQPDRPDEVMIFWTNAETVGRGMVEMKVRGAGTDVKIWGLKNEEVNDCASAKGPAT